MDVKNVKVIVKKQIDNNFPWSVLSSTKCRQNVQNFAVKPLACEYFDVIFMVDKIRVQTVEYCCRFVKRTNSGNFSQLDSILEDKAFNSRETLFIVLCDFSILSGLHEHPAMKLI